MTLLSRITSLENKKHIFLILLFAAAFFFRLPTLFNDYYDVDELSAIVQTHEYMAGDIPGKDFIESKLPLYHAVFKAAYAIDPQNGWMLVHVFTILIVFLTALFIFLAGNKIDGFKTGAIASLFYAVFISSFNRHFMATNGEIVYNLPVAAGFFFFILFLDDRRKAMQKFVFLLASILMGLCAIYVKFHGIILYIFLVIMFLIYIPYYKNKFTLKYLSLLLSVFIGFLAIAVVDYFSARMFAPGLASETAGMIAYASGQGFNPVFFIVKYVHRQLMPALWHFAVWIPAFAAVFLFAKKRFKLDSLPVSAAVILFILSYLMIFAGASRLYFHYFMTCYPALCIVGAYIILKTDFRLINKIRDKFTVLFLIPAVFFFAWNVKDIIIKHIFPQAFYNEGKALYWTRAVLIGTFNDYLLPEASYRDAATYIKSVTNPGDRIFVWGDGPYLYYFSGRKMGTMHLWPKTWIIGLTALYNKSDIESNKAAEESEKGFIDENLKKKKPVLIIDTSENGLSTFNYKVTPLIEKYIKNNYYFINEVDKMKIYRIKNN
jgi:hypothetical protein